MLFNFESHNKIQSFLTIYMTTILYLTEKTRYIHWKLEFKMKIYIYKKWFKTIVLHKEIFTTNWTLDFINEKYNVSHESWIFFYRKQKRDSSHCGWRFFRSLACCSPPTGWVSKETTQEEVVISRQPTVVWRNKPR